MLIDMLDTNILIYAMKNRPAHLKKTLQSTCGANVYYLR